MPTQRGSRARCSEIPLKIAAKIDRVDQAYFDTGVAGLIEGSLVDFIGEITEVEKTRFLGDAIALLFPIDWPEPFGLTMIEAMACGTPIIGFRRRATATSTNWQGSRTAPSCHD